MMVRAGLGVGMDRHRAGPDLLRADPGKVDRGAVHAGGLRGVGVEPVARDHLTPCVSRGRLIQGSCLDRRLSWRPPGAMASILVRGPATPRRRLGGSTSKPWTPILIGWSLQCSPLAARCVSGLAPYVTFRLCSVWSGRRARSYSGKSRLRLTRSILPVLLLYIGKLIIDEVVAQTQLALPGAISAIGSRAAALISRWAARYGVALAIIADLLGGPARSSTACSRNATATSPASV